MAIFSKAFQALQAGLEILKAIELYNKKRESKGKKPILLGIAINWGPVILGPVGDSQRMTGTGWKHFI
jgi:adenylate cyclase